jgi:hypothetical protein
LELKKSKFPLELVVGMKRRGKKKVKWNFKEEDRIFKDLEKNEKLSAKRRGFEEYHSDEDDEEEEEG